LKTHLKHGFVIDFTDGALGDWGGAPLEDVRKGFMHALKMYPEIDPERAVALGWSYGGYMIKYYRSYTAVQDADLSRCTV
jgi:hypothetical protein